MSLTISQWHKCRHAGTIIFPYKGVIDHWSMTRMHIAKFELNSVHSCHWPLVNDTNADTRGQLSFLIEMSLTIGQWHECRHAGTIIFPYRGVIDHWSMTRMHIAESESSSVHSCHWPLVNDTNADTQGQLSFLIKVSLTTGQWHECILLSLNKTQCIRVNDDWSMTGMPTRRDNYLSL